MKTLVFAVILCGCCAPTEPEVRVVYVQKLPYVHPLVRPDVSAIDTTQTGCKQCHDFRMRTP